MSLNEEQSLTSQLYNLDAERAVLGACMLDVRAANEVREQISAVDFYSQMHRIIFSCIEHIVDEAQPCDPVTVGNALRATGDLERIGGMAYLSGLLDAVPAPSAAVHYAKIVADKARTRSLRDALNDVLLGINEGGHSADELTDMAERTVFQVASGRRRNELYALSELLTPVYIMMSKISNAGGVTGVPTFTDLDKLLSGLQRSDLVLLAARPGCGKTSMAINIAQNAAVDKDMTVVVFSLEMPKEQLVQRMLCTEARVDHARVRKGMASREDFRRLKKAVNRMSQAKIYIDDTMSITVSEMRSKCRKLSMEHPLDLVVVDYIQLMQASAGRKVENRQLEVAEISRSLKAMAKELDVPVLGLCQLSRQAESAKEPPGLAHLRESGALEQDADVVLMLYPQRKADEEEDEESRLKRGGSGEAIEVIVAKHRNGPTGSVIMQFVKEYTRFENSTAGWVDDNDIPPPPPEDIVPVAEEVF